jgi:two-component system sensor histidine kinase KdpD
MAKQAGAIRGTSLANEYVTAISIIAATAAVGVVLRPYLQVTDIAMLFLLAVVIVGYRHRSGPAVVASLLSIAAFDFGFVPPYYTFNVHNAAYVLTFGVMLVVALIMTHLTTRIREQAADAEEREHRTAALFALSRELAGAESLSAQVSIATRHMSEHGRGQATVVLKEAGRESAADLWADHGMFDSVAVRVAATWVYQHGESAGWGTGQCAEAEALVVPLRSSSRTLGVVTLKPEAVERMLSPAERRTLEALSSQAATALERTMLAQGHEQARVEVESERLRTALLSSLSHDLRTPLGSIEGAASSLLQEPGALPREVQREMAETILEESRRMTRLVTNLLDMVRVETGALAVQKAWQPLEEALGVALLRLEERLATHVVETRLPAGLPLVPIDELLIEQVFINLLENAAKYTPPGTPILVSAWQEGNAVVVEVADAGPGVPEGDEEAIFRKFHRSTRADQASPAGGSGLGLTICRGIMAAHGGRIWLERHGNGGAAFRFTLPLVGPPLGFPPTDAAA